VVIHISQDQKNRQAELEANTSRTPAEEAELNQLKALAADNAVKTA